MKTDNFPNNLRAIIEEMGLSLLQYCKANKLPYATIYAIVNGKRIPTDRTIKKILRTFKGKKTLKDLGFN